MGGRMSGWDGGCVDCSNNGRRRLNTHGTISLRCLEGELRLLPPCRGVESPRVWQAGSGWETGGFIRPFFPRNSAILSRVSNEEKSLPC